MTAQIIDGTAIAERLRADIAAEAARFKDTFGYPPGLGAVLAGDNPASVSYVKMKRRACEQVGITSVAHLLSADSGQDELDGMIQSLNDDPAIHGILVQLPLPKHIDEERALRL